MRKPVDKARLEAACRELLLAIGEDPDREGLRDTPKRWSKWWEEFTHGSKESAMTTFNDPHAEMIVVSRLESWSLCEHHLLPFKVRVKIGYIPAGKILGLSKFARILHSVSSRLQVQERLTDELVAAVQKATGSPHVIVTVVGSHLCMEMRGARTAAQTTTGARSGRFLQEVWLKQFSSISE